MARSREVDFTSIDTWNTISGNSHGVHVTPLQAVRRFCWSCQGGHEDPWPMADGKVDKPLRPSEEVKKCTTKTCWLYPYRMGRGQRRAK